MKKNKLTIFLILIIVILSGYIIYDKFINKDSSLKEDVVYSPKIIDEIDLPYASIYLMNDGISYLKPINKEEIAALKLGSNLTDRLNTLYDRAFYYDIFINNYKLKGFRFKLSKEIEKIKKVEIDNETFIVFLKKDNTIGLFSYLDYVDLLYTYAIDNYLDLKNILDIESDGKIIYLDGSSSNLKIEK